MKHLSRSLLLLFVVVLFSSAHALETTTEGYSLAVKAYLTPREGNSYETELKFRGKRVPNGTVAWFRTVDGERIRPTEYKRALLFHEGKEYSFVSVFKRDLQRCNPFYSTGNKAMFYSTIEDGACVLFYDGTTIPAATPTASSSYISEVYLKLENQSAICARGLNNQALKARFEAYFKDCQVVLDQLANGKLDIDDPQAIAKLYNTHCG